MATDSSKLPIDQLNLKKSQMLAIVHEMEENAKMKWPDLGLKTKLEYQAFNTAIKGIIKLTPVKILNELWTLFFGKVWHVYYENVKAIDPMLRFLDAKDVEIELPEELEVS